MNQHQRARRQVLKAGGGLTLLGALGGVLAFGFLGLFLGPVLLASIYAAYREIFFSV